MGRPLMAHCTECGAEVGDEQTFCDECGAELASDADSARDGSFTDRYGAKPLPFAEGRSELINLYGRVLGSIPIFGGIMKAFLGLSFWCYGFWLTVLRVVTVGSDVTKRFSADFDFLKDSFYSGYRGEEPPSPPK